MQQYTPLIIFAIWALIITLFYYFQNKPQKVVIQKYGQPIKHFLGIIYFGSGYAHIYIYENIIVIKTIGNEIVLTKNSDNYKIYGTIFRSCIEVNHNGYNYKINFNGFYAKYIKEFFDID